jgi:DnaK suppressor protein
MQQNDYYHALLSRKEEIEKQINRKREILQTPLSESTDELSSYDQHPGDLGTDTFEREKELGLLEMLEFEMTKVNDAINRCHNGSYGLCDQCGKPIEPGRLERLTNTTMCAACAQTQADHFNRPAEEELSIASHMYNPRADIAGYSYTDYKKID